MVNKSDKSSAGKGDSYRKVDREKWEKGWERIFGNKKSENQCNICDGSGWVQDGGIFSKFLKCECQKKEI